MLNKAELETFLVEEMDAKETSELLDNSIFNLVDSHLELHGESELRQQVYNLRRLRDIFSKSN